MLSTDAVTRAALFAFVVIVLAAVLWAVGQSGLEPLRLPIP